MYYFKDEKQVAKEEVIIRKDLTNTRHNPRISLIEQNGWNSNENWIGADTNVRLFLVHLFVPLPFTVAPIYTMLYMYIFHEGASSSFWDYTFKKKNECKCRVNRIFGDSISGCLSTYNKTKKKWIHLILNKIPIRSIVYLLQFVLK